MRSSVFLCLVLLSSSLMAQVNQKLTNGQWAYYGEEFYSKLSTKMVKGSMTKEVLFRIFDNYHNFSKGKPDTLSTNCITNCYRFSSVGYDNARKILFGELFVKKDNQGTFVEDVYCAKEFRFRQVSDISNMGRLVNIEHTWPQSKFNAGFEKGLQKADLHHLYPTDSDANNRRGNHDFGDIGNHPNELNVHDCETSRMANISGEDIFSPPVTHRGNVARSLFYFAARYKMVINPTQEKFLRQWHQADPIDQAERDRHEVISTYQNSRNPFVDHPELVDIITDF